MNNHEQSLSTEELLQLCNREESFRSTLVSLLESSSIEEFDAIVESAQSQMSSSLIPFMNDLREIYMDNPLRIVVINLLEERLNQSQVRGLSFLLTTHVEQVQRVDLLRNRMYQTARETIENHVPIFDELSRFLATLSSDSEWESESCPALNDEFYEELKEAVMMDSRITGKFLEQVCRSDEFRKSIVDSLDSYPEVVQVLWKMADSLVQSQRYIAEIEIEDLLHDIEEHPSDEEE